ncbi:MAG: RNA polymerase sigma factor [Candidatus Rifleibacteriota bacterium]
MRISEKQIELETLLESAKNGDKRAFSRIIERFYGTVVCFLLSRGNRLQDAEDLAQETFLTAYNKLDQFKNSGSFSGWLISIAKNLFIDKVRREKNKENLVGGEALEVWATHSQTPEQLILEKEKLNEIYEQLEPKERLILDLRVLQRLPYAEISEIMDLSEVNIRVLLHRLLKRLKI